MWAVSIVVFLRGHRVPFLNYQKGIYRAAAAARAGRALDPDLGEVPL